MSQSTNTLVVSLCFAAVYGVCSTITDDPSCQQQVCITVSLAMLSSPPDFSIIRTSSDGSVRVYVEGTLDFRLGPNGSISALLITPVTTGRGFFSFGAVTDAYIWQVGPSTFGETVTAVLSTSSIYDGSGDAFSTEGDAVPVLGENPSLSETLHLTVGAGDTGYSLTRITDSFTQKFSLRFFNPNAGVAIRAHIVQVGSFYGSGTTVVAPEPSGRALLPLGAIVMAVLLSSRCGRRNHFRVNHMNFRSNFRST
jgi:hypothetical protein